MYKAVRTVVIALLFCLISVVLLCATLPHWLPTLVRYCLPVSWQLHSTPLKWSRQGLLIPSLQLTDDRGCRVTQLQQGQISLHNRQLAMTIGELIIDSHCSTVKAPATVQAVAVQPATVDTASTESSLSWHDLWRWLPPFSLEVKAVTLHPWKHYHGVFSARSGQSQQDKKIVQLNYRSTYLNSDITLTSATLNINSFTLTREDQSSSFDGKGVITLPAKVTQLPVAAQLSGGFYWQQLPYLFNYAINWQNNSGVFTVQEQSSTATVLTLPWQWQSGQLRVEQGTWSWPVAEQQITGMISLIVNPHQGQWQQSTVAARLNMLTTGKLGKGNLLLSAGPGVIGTKGYQLPVQLTGRVNTGTVTAIASIPAQVGGDLAAPQIELQTGALLRAKGKISPTMTLEELRLPLAGLQLTTQGVTGRLQAIMTLNEAIWGNFRINMEGKATQFTTQSGLWQWKYWGEGEMPVFSARWGVNGTGRWLDNLIQLNELNTGFNQLRYGQTLLHKPLLQLQTPLQWRRAGKNSSLSANFLFTTGRTELPRGGHLPPLKLTLALKGQTPADFLWHAGLTARKIGPIQGSGRWGGKRLRGKFEWTEQPLQLFQPLLPPELGWTIRSGTLNARMAFSASFEQGLQMGGHTVLKEGSLWLKEGELSGLNFTMPLRLRDHRWLFGPKAPVTLDIASLTTLFKIKNITASLQGSYPFDEQHPLRLSGVSLELLNGRLTLSELQLPQYQPAILKLQQISLSELLTAFRQKQFMLSGEINGALPLYLQDAHWWVRDGWVANRNALTLRLDQQLADQVSADNLVADVALEWLRYLEIHRSSGTVKVDKKGNMILLAKVKGYNTQKSRSKMVQLNYRHEENLFQLWKSLRFGDNMEEWLEETANGLGKNEKSR